MYDGKVIHSARDEFGSIDIVDESTTRTMHFGSRARQTTMFLRDPVALALSYTRYMLSGLLLSSVPRSVLMLGLGGGALARFVRHHWPGCRIEAVEKRPLVIALAREYFALPDESFAVHVMAAEAFLAGKRLDEYDWILVDVHDHNGMSPALREPEFFARCRARLSARGILAANLWTGDREAMLKGINRSLHQVFGGRVLHLPVARKRNAVALGCNFAPPAFEVRLARRKALALEDRHGVEFSQFFWELIQNNPDLLH